jgi:hypothetical protein
MSDRKSQLAWLRHEKEISENADRDHQSIVAVARSYSENTKKISKF